GRAGRKRDLLVVEPDLEEALGVVLADELHGVGLAHGPRSRRAGRVLHDDLLRGAVLRARRAPDHHDPVAVGAEAKLDAAAAAASAAAAGGRRAAIRQGADEEVEDRLDAAADGERSLRRLEPSEVLL